MGPAGGEKHETQETLEGNQLGLFFPHRWRGQARRVANLRDGVSGPHKAGGVSGAVAVDDDAARQGER